MSNPEDSLQRIVLRDAEAVLPDRIIRADLVIEGTVIANLAPPGSATGDEIWDLGGRRVTPGWIDAHIHGVNGTDFSRTDAEAIAASAEDLAAMGITTIYPTIVPGTEQEMVAALRECSRAM